METKRFFIRTYGCQMNEYDSQCIAGQLLAEGFNEVDGPEKTDVILFNTCSVREHAAQRFYTNLGDTLRLKEKKPDLIVGVCGCVAEQDGLRILERFPWVKLIAGPGNISEIGKAVKKIIENNSRIVMVGNFDKTTCQKIARKNKDSAFVTIIRGCNNFCSYCVVPYLRGREQSRPMDEILEEVKQIAKDGYKEVMLLGQNVCAYNDFAGLLEKVNEIEGIERIRFMTSHPRDVNQKLINAVASLDKVCKEFHLPVQSGSNKILEAMNRGYTREYYLNLINLIRARIPGVRITTDIMVGFPGETEDDFQETIELVGEVNFDDAFMFKYSDRPQTRALQMREKISDEVKINRLKKLISVIRKGRGNAKVKCAKG